MKIALLLKDAIWVLFWVRMNKEVEIRCCGKCLMQKVRYVFGLYSGNVVERKVDRKRGHKRWSE